MSLKITESISLPNDAVTAPFKPLLKSYPSSMHNQTLADAAGYTAGAGAFNNPRGRLKTLGLIEYPQPGMVRARDLLFPL